LGMILEKVTGRSYPDLLASEIMNPLHMAHSGYGADQPSYPGEVSGYKFSGDKVEAADTISMLIPFAAGAIVASVDDLLLWDNALGAGKVVKAESFQRMVTPPTL